METKLPVSDKIKLKKHYKMFHKRAPLKILPKAFKMLPTNPDFRANLGLPNAISSKPRPFFDHKCMTVSRNFLSLLE